MRRSFIYRYMKGAPFANRRHLVGKRKGHLSRHRLDLYEINTRWRSESTFWSTLHFWLPHVSWCSNHDHFILQPTSPVDNFHSAWKIFKPNITDRLLIPGRTSKFRSSCDFTGFNGLLVGLILLSSDIATTVSFSSKASIKCLVMNGRSLKSIHYSQGVVNSARYNLHCFQDLVYTED